MEPTLVEQEPTLADLQAQWRGALYAEPGTNLNGHAVGEFSWKGISVSRDNRKELLRVTLGGKKLGPTKKRPPPGSDEEKQVVRELALRLIAAYEEGEGGAYEAEDEQADKAEDELAHEEVEEAEEEEEVEAPVPPLFATEPMDEPVRGHA